MAADDPTTPLPSDSEAGVDHISALPASPDDVLDMHLKFDEIALVGTYGAEVILAGLEARAQRAVAQLVDQLARGPVEVAGKQMSGVAHIVSPPQRYVFRQGNRKYARFAVYLVLL